MGKSMKTLAQCQCVPVRMSRLVFLTVCVPLPVRVSSISKGNNITGSRGLKPGDELLFGGKDLEVIVCIAIVCRIVASFPPLLTSRLMNSFG